MQVPQTIVSLFQLLSDAPGNIRSKVLSLYGFLAILNVGAWIWAAVVFRHNTVLLGTALLAYTFGLRHAVDADHIAAIDNVTRKLMQEGKRPVAAGFMFSLGHSTIVVIGALLIASTTLALQHRMVQFRNVADLVGTTISALFLIGIALINLAVFISVYRAFVRFRKGADYVEEDLNLLLSKRGLLANVLRPVLARIGSSWHMYPLGLLFGLGFDTATEIGLLSLSAAEVSKGLSLGTILVFPILFAAGMCLIDTTDNILMLGAYGWAFVKPVRKLYYNMTITLVSVLVALVVGGIEVLGLVADHLRRESMLWQGVRRLNANLSGLGCFIIGVFVVSWILSIAFYRWLRLDDLEVQAEAAAPPLP